MPQRLKVLDRAQIGLSVFVSPHIEEPWRGMKGNIIRAKKEHVLVKFPEGVFEEFPQKFLLELEEL
jgi:hypothetical protein